MQADIAIPPEDIDTETNTVALKLDKSVTTQGKWLLSLKIVNQEGKTAFTSPAAEVYFDRRVGV